MPCTVTHGVSDADAARCSICRGNRPEGQPVAQAPAILHHHLAVDVPDVRLVRPTRALSDTVTGDDVHARRSVDLVPTPMLEALWIARRE